MLLNNENPTNVQSEPQIDEILFNEFKENYMEEKNSQFDLEEEINLLDDDLNLEQAAYDYKYNNIAEAFDYIYEHYKPILDRLAKRKKDEDLSQELSEVLWNATLKFDPNAGVKFNTFFWTCAQNHMGTQNIRKNALKRSGAKKVETKIYNPETGEHEVVVETIKTQTISLQTTLNSKDSESELGSLIESDTFKNEYDTTNLNLSLDKLFNDGLIKEKEYQAIKMIMNDAKLHEIGEKLGGVTAPAIHVMLRRLQNRKNLRKQLLEILQ
jgi:DNA-directed RNA polymerase, sigma subunit (sigma70/sigma32)